jgi:hypothetical protein
VASSILSEGTPSSVVSRACMALSSFRRFPSGRR